MDRKNERHTERENDVSHRDPFALFCLIEEVPVKILDRNDDKNEKDGYARYEQRQ